MYLLRFDVRHEGAVVFVSHRVTSETQTIFTNPTLGSIHTYLLATAIITKNGYSTHFFALIMLTLLWTEPKAKILRSLISFSFTLYKVLTLLIFIIQSQQKTIKRTHTLFIHNYGTIRILFTCTLYSSYNALRFKCTKSSCSVFTPFDTEFNFAF